MSLLRPRNKFARPRGLISLRSILFILILVGGLWFIYGAEVSFSGGFDIKSHQKRYKDAWYEVLMDKTVDIGKTIIGVVF